MNNDTRESIARARALRTTLFWVGIAALIGTTSCSTVPDWSKREAHLTHLSVHYESRSDPTEILLPASSDALLIEELAIEPPDLRQSFAAGRRCLHLPAGEHPVVVRCRYRLFRDRDDDGEAAPWPSPRQLFPGATRIQLLHSADQ